MRCLHEPTKESEVFLTRSRMTGGRRSARPNLMNYSSLLLGRLALGAILKKIGFPVTPSNRGLDRCAIRRDKCLEVGHRPRREQRLSVLFKCSSKYRRKHALTNRVVSQVNRSNPQRVAFWCAIGGLSALVHCNLRWPAMLRKAANTARLAVTQDSQHHVRRGPVRPNPSLNRTLHSLPVFMLVQTLA